MAHKIAISVAVAAFLLSTAYAELLPNGVLNDEQTSIVYYPDTGEIAAEAPASRQLTSINIGSDGGIFIADHVRNGVCSSGFGRDCAVLFWAPFGEWSFSVSFGNVAQAGLSENFVANNLTVLGSLDGGDELGPVDLVYMHELYPGDANRDLSFDQLDLVQVLQAAKYLTGEPATWGEGDWNGGPGGYPGEPPPGDGLFNQQDIVAALQTGMYLGKQVTAPPHLLPGDADQNLSCNQLDFVQVLQRGKYLTGEAATWGEGDWNGAPGGSRGNPPPGDGVFDQLDLISALGCGCPYLTGPYAAIGHGRSLGDVDLIYIPEPCAFVLAAMGFGLFTLSRRHQKKAAVALFFLAMVAAPISSTYAELLPNGVLNDEQTSININSVAGILTGEPVQHLGGRRRGPTLITHDRRRR